MACEPACRRSLRLKGYDYAQPGAYFVTVVTQDRACLFGAVVDGAAQLNDAGKMVERQWQSLPQRFPTVVLDTYVIMPNHFHAILILRPPPVGAGLVPAQDETLVGAGLVPAQDGATTRVAPTVGDVVGAFKSITTVEYVRGVKCHGWAPFRGRLWQRNYYEHVIRDEASLDRIRRYIVENPLRWDLDRENPDRVGEDPEWDALFGARRRRAPTRAEGVALEEGLSWQDDLQRGA